MKQTAVEWLEKELKAIRLDVDKNVLKFIDKSFEIAKEMEKEQIIASCHFAYNEGCTYMCGSTTKYKSFEQYYNETFNK